MISAENVLVGLLLLAGVVYLWVSPRRLLVALLGIVLPLYSIRGSDPLLVDALRLAITAVLFLRPGWTRPVNSHPMILFLLIGSGFLLIAANNGDQRGIAYALSLVLGSLVALSVARGFETYFLTGFACGCALSAAAVVLQVTVGLGLGPDSQGVTGFDGLGPSSTLTGPLLALAAVVVLLDLTRFSGALKAGVLLVLTTGTAMTGSRSGLLALIVGGTAVLLQRTETNRRRFWILGGFMSIMVTGVLLQFASIDRLLLLGGQASQSSIQSDYGTGRVLLNARALQDLPPYILTGGAPIAGHSVFLSWVATYGVIGIISLLGVAFVFARVLPWPLFAMFLVVGLLETAGLLAGASSLPVLLVIASLQRSDQRTCRDSIEAN